ncbi:hypothetical protein GBA52_009270 [Prunus armeniaca]|nr:hypothetical protein GBA52_009270 [Prunus armeniaca]
MAQLSRVHQRLRSLSSKYETLAPISIKVFSSNETKFMNFGYFMDAALVSLSFPPAPDGSGFISTRELQRALSSYNRG